MMDTSPTDLFQLFLDSRRRAEELIDAFRSKEAPWMTPARLRALLAALNIGVSFIEATGLLRDAITGLLGDVDRTAVTIETENYPLNNSALNVLILSQAPTGYLTTRALKESERLPLGRLENSFRQMETSGLPVGDYQPPVFVPLTAHADRYVGGFILLRSLHSPQISSQTLGLVESLRPIFEQVFFHLSVRAQLERRRQLTLFDAITTIIKECRLTPLEGRALILLLYGCSYNEIAADLGVTINTVRKHVKSIHAKTETSSTVDIYAKFLAQRIVS